MQKSYIGINQTLALLVMMQDQARVSEQLLPCQQRLAASAVLLL
jgi:hypothetical protein